ncbi:hypothetical protein C8Q75DRAFT_864251 [Abortiporus biennis]|nr:hypothetical protein C8Q75DRAFT_864251 [Abortiporus biennis]
MDVRHTHGTDVFVVRACYHSDGIDLVAIGGAHSVQVLIATESTCKVIANFHIGCRITALAWSSRSTSPTTTDDWLIELTAAGIDFGLYLLTKRANGAEDVFPFGGGLSGHHGKVNDMTFCGGQSEDSCRYVATVSDDKMLMVWDLDPSLNLQIPNSPDADSSTSSRPQPTAYVISFPHPLTTVCSHPSTSKEFLVADARGSIFLTDWRSDPDENQQLSWRNSSIVELVEPKALADAVSGTKVRSSGSAAWRSDSPDIIGAVYGSRFALWDLAKLQGGKPAVTGTSFPEGGNRFRWCPTYPDYFAISTNSPTRGATIHVYNTTYINAEPTSLQVASKPLYIRDFDFLAEDGIPRIVAAVGRDVIVFYIGVES